MAIKLVMPALSPTMTKGKIAKWNVKDGDTISIGQVIADIETDKATMELESIEEGIMGKILVEEGAEDVEIGTPIAWLFSDENDSIPDDLIVPKKAELESEPENLKIIDTIAKENTNTNTMNESKNSKSTPAARARANEIGVDLDKVVGTGPNRRIREQDVMLHKNNLPSIDKQNQIEAKGINEIKEYKRGEFDLLKPSAMQTVVAKRMAESKSNIPHAYLQISVILDNLLKIKSDFSHNGVATTLTHWFILMCGHALKAVPQVNVSWSEEGLKYYKSSDVAFAVSLNQGLITPVIHDVCNMKISDLAHKTNELIERAKSGKLLPEEYSTGTITISNLGMYGIDSFYPIINPPQAAILGVGAAKEELYMENDKIHTRKVLCCTISVDHRAANGADAANFLGHFKKFVENPYLVML